jgi:CelD/BcsL family acetyltransferase involved in cellulose biosynthesis
MIGTLRFEVVVSFDRLAEIGPAWRELWSRCPGATPFSSPEWLLPWCRHLAEGPPWSVLAWRGGDLAALAPTFVYEDRGQRILGLLGGGASDYQDVLADEPATAEAVLVTLLEGPHRCDRCELEALSPESPLLAAAARLGGEIVPQQVCTALALPGRPEDLARGISRKLREDVQRQRRGFARAGAEVVRATGATTEELLDDLFRLHAARWSEPETPAGARLRKFHAEAARALQAAGMLRMIALRLDGCTLGVLYGFSARGRAYAYLLGIDSSTARYSPGSVLLACAAEDAIHEGARELDFLRGGEAFKYRWGAVERWTSRLTLVPTRAVTSGAPPPR